MLIHFSLPGGEFPILGSRACGQAPSRKTVTVPHRLEDEAFPPLTDLLEKVQQICKSWTNKNVLQFRQNSKVIGAENYCLEFSNVRICRVGTLSRPQVNLFGLSPERLCPTTHIPLV